MTEWADLAYDMWALLAATSPEGIGGDVAAWEARKAEVRQRLVELLLDVPAPPGSDVRVEWREPVVHHPEPGYSPVRVPENTGKHLRESAETYTDADGNEACPSTCSCRKEAKP